jgi:Tfp pilus assembly protein PilX
MTEKKGKPGNPNPSPATRFGAGNRANPNGKTSEQKRLEMSTAEAALRNAEAAIRIRAKLLAATEAQIASAKPDEVMVMIEAAMLKLLTDSETRGLGAPVQPVDHSSTDGSMTPKPNVIEFVAPKALDESDD